MVFFNVNAQLWVYFFGPMAYNTPGATHQVVGIGAKSATIFVESEVPGTTKTELRQLVVLFHAAPGGSSPFGRIKAEAATLDVHRREIMLKKIILKGGA